MLALVLAAASVCQAPDQYGTPTVWCHRRVVFCCRVACEGLPRERALRCYREAVARWEAACGIEAAWTDDPAKADVVASCGAIDGPGTKLGWSNYPRTPTAYQVFDEAEGYASWPDDYLIALFAHETGHALGLTHSPEEGDVMWPYVRATHHRPSANDGKRAAALYGPPRG